MWDELNHSNCKVDVFFPIPSFRLITLVELMEKYYDRA